MDQEEIRQDHAVPVLPSRNPQLTVDFYSRLGFSATVFVSHGGYAILRRGTIELQFFPYPDLDPKSSSFGCYVRVHAIDALHREFAGTQLLPSHGFPRLTEVEDKPWGMREFALVDIDSNLLRFGQKI